MIGQSLQFQSQMSYALYSNQMLYYQASMRPAMNTMSYPIQTYKNYYKSISFKIKFWPLQVAPSQLLLGMMMGYVTSHLNVCCWPCGKIRDGGTCWGCPSPHQLSPWGRHVSQLSASLLSVVVFLCLLCLVVQQILMQQALYLLTVYFVTFLVSCK